MRIVTSVAEMVQTRKELGCATVGLVPTMGYLHRGHMSLVERAISETQVSVVSLFVNPTQFGPSEDFTRYPRDLERDQSLLESMGTNYVFVPEASDMYPAGAATHISVEGVTEGLEGAHRPGHFDGVSTVVAKLLNIVRPDRAYFGMKDAQQLAVIKQMVRDLNVPVDIVGCPTVREADGLAMSSRNMYLSLEDRRRALHISGGLLRARELWRSGERRAQHLESAVRGEMASAGMEAIDYVTMVSTVTFKPVPIADGAVAIVVAARVGETRLIDNITLE